MEKQTRLRQLGQEQEFNKLRTEIEKQIEATKKRSKDVERFEYEAAQQRPNLEEIQ